MPHVCPICKSRALELLRTSDATGFYCKIHGHFKVADTVAVDEYYTRAEWEAALRSAKYKAMEGEWPVIRQGDFLERAGDQHVGQSDTTPATSIIHRNPSK